jgi:hypothetical protein
MEWSLAAAALAAVLTWLVGFHWPSLSAEQAALIMTAVNAVVGAVAAWRTVPRSPQAFVYMIGSLAALGTAYGAHWSQESVSLFSSALIAVLGLVVRWQVSPVESVDPRVLGQPPA